MKRLLLACLLMAGAAPVLADDAQSADAVITPAAPFTGWHWYNEPKKKPETPAPKVKPPQPGVPDFSKLTPSEQADVLKGYTKEALNNAILHPSAENTATFLRWQKFWTDRASMFSQSFAVAQLDHPDLDYNLEHPHYNSTAPLQQARDQEEQNDAIKKLSGEYGLFYFYRGQDPIDAQMAGVVADFARLRHISLIPVSVDGTVSPQVPDSRTDAGQTARMGITHFPALFLVDPKSKNYRPLAYGFMTQDDLAKRFLNVATGFKPNF
ncbi:type-F conjugative transfer system pilin assembly protein TraF [Pantoea allii]|uniref:Type-F conjugative transfer system pilin assembly protein TraF n=1 Tax=Pantoea allii TaxID=574096 RepID=A0ABS6VK11_9GAMM|nr:MULTISPECIES: type-F conjugative transfer system pilin assembly protein TraF [Pantoea]MBW1215831.1 type-F conjugative transfer system pilin assembly protein TraF [Pantoea allii]MBW1254598.1 type-F conjugative transfer system pilin assembly protein TraF [Pantoea allii]MBW1259425.1 type-F conjugative transfer system pilin assembly protein TraF [Pantoea allii]MBW1263742.1 type-F conjugative transfer system pilin assembly protein TraF [Pantoea allii]MBW1268529.1 type-F conjugative transfer syst